MGIYEMAMTLLKRDSLIVFTQTNPVAVENPPDTLYSLFLSAYPEQFVPKQGTCH